MALGRWYTEGIGMVGRGGGPDQVTLGVQQRVHILSVVVNGSRKDGVG